MRKTSLSTAGQTYRTNLYNDLREEARASSYLLAFAQDTPDLTLKVSPGNPYFGTTLVEFAGGNSPEFTAPSSDPRIDILTLKDDGNLNRVEGTEASSPEAPAVPTGEIPIAQVFNRVDQTSIKDEDDSSNGYIEKDLRPFMRDNREWMELGELTFENGVVGDNKFTLPETYDLVRCSFYLQGQDQLGTFKMRMNDVDTSDYGRRRTDGNSVFGSSYLVIGNLEDGRRLLGDLIIDGRHAAGLKNVTANIVSNRMAEVIAHGGLRNDENDLSSVEFSYYNSTEEMKNLDGKIKIYAKNM